MYSDMEYFGESMYQVDLSKVQKQLRKVPRFVLKALQEWVFAVELNGLQEIRKLKGYHDEPLKGARAGQRSVRLNRLWRVIYTETQSGQIRLVVVEEVTAHDYRTK